MELIIQEIAEVIRVEFAEEKQRLLTEVRDISEFIMATQTMLDGIGVKLVAEAMETLDKAVRESADRKRTWVVKSKGDIKNLATIFGEVSYKRTYYQNKKTGEYSYLSDELVGIAAHDKLDTSLQARLIEEAIDMPYRRSGKKAAEAVELTSQTVMNSIRKLGSVDNNAVKIKDNKKIVKTLYIEADEDHVALQDGKCAEPKLVYVHEGIKEVGKERWELVNPRYFSGIYTNSDELWLEVADYIDEAYDAKLIEKIYLSGDGASWIKNGLGWLKGSIYVLDRYHLSKYVTQATAHMSDITPFMWKYINNGERKKLKKLFTQIISSTETDTKKKSVREARSYILGNWDGIRNQYEPDYVGCSAEGHVSHILSARLSSRPLGWCKIGVDQMARLRAFEANGGVVYDLLLAKKRNKLSKARQLKLDQEILKKRTQVATNETFGNIAILNKGKKTATAQFLRSIRTA
ncbi:MAG: ISLre2 family transposase [Syntrophomonadaceae bacterium]|jgi:hypothetical protein